MKLQKILLFVSILTLSFSISIVQAKNDNPAYVIYDTKGKQVTYSKVLKALGEADMVFIGELHNNPICHWLQLEFTEDLYDSKQGSIIIGAEMFEADDQLILDEYIGGIVSEKNFKADAKLWPNHQTDYKPLVDFAKEKKLKFVATNIPRRYASIVYKKGLSYLDSLDAEAKKFIAPLPIKYDAELKEYKNMLKMAGVHGGENLPKAQAIKDATMAHFIISNWKEDNLFIHYNGTYHSNNYEGIVWYISQSNPNLKTITIATIEQKDINKLEEENKKLADFTICVPENMTKTH